MVVYKQFKSGRAFGIELETSRNLSEQRVKSLIVTGDTNRRVTVTGYSASKNNRNWHLKVDCSCGTGEDDYGWEIASYKGVGIDDIVSMSNVAERLYQHGLRTNPRCGLHVHCEVADFTPFRMGYLIARWLAMEPWLFNAVPFRRSASVYCRGLRFVRPFKERFLQTNEKYGPQEVWDFFKPEYKVYGGQDYRRVALNLCNFYMELNKTRKRRSTVELRLPEGTLRGVEVKNWVRFFVHFVDTAARDRKLFSMEAKTLDDFFNAAGLGHDDGFSILSPGLRETKIWLLKRLKKHSYNRNGQAIEEYLHRMTWPEKLPL
jgi:hypothetical protein